MVLPLLYIEYRTNLTLDQNTYAADVGRISCYQMSPLGIRAITSEKYSTLAEFF